MNKDVAADEIELGLGGRGLVDQAGKLLRLSVVEDLRSAGLLVSLFLGLFLALQIAMIVMFMMMVR